MHRMSSQVLALVTHDAALVQCELDRVRTAFPLESMSVSGMGAWQDDHLIQRTFGAGVPTSELWEAPDSEMVMLGSRVLGVGQEMDTAAQPFRFRQWMFCAVGELDRSPDVRERLWNELPEFLQAAVRGPTWEEVAFVRFLAELRAVGRMEDPQLDVPTTTACLSAAAKAIEQVSSAVGVARRPSFGLVASNGRVLAATRRGEQTLSYVLLEGRVECERHEISGDARDGQPLVRDHRRRRSVVLSSSPGEGWVSLPDGATLGVERKLTVTVK
jgi:glutamine amidotransferase